MANLILCSQKRAARPFYVPGIGKNIYSIEELCYVFYHHTILVDDNLINEELYEWIRQELHMEKLYEKLSDLYRNGASFKMFVYYVFQSINYCTEKESEEITGYLGKIETMSSWERQKLRGDFLIRDKQYQAAIDLYSELLKKRKQRRSQGIIEEANAVTASVFHNMGVAYAHLGFFGKAMICMEAAYELSGSFESCLEYLYLTNKQEGPISMEKRLREMPLSEEQLRTALEERMEKAEEAGKKIESKELWKKLPEWKQEFRSMTGMN